MNRSVDRDDWQTDGNDHRTRTGDGETPELDLDPGLETLMAFVLFVLVAFVLLAVDASVSLRSSRRVPFRSCPVKGCRPI